MYVLNYNQIDIGISLAWRERKNIYYCKDNIIVAEEKSFSMHKLVDDKHDYKDVYVITRDEYNNYNKFKKENYELITILNLLHIGRKV